ncbi:MaoC family dehydratase [Deferrisoma camini]|uniref:MaoC family dehydratase n=1 Tax=Deferrisoma camini TaxID=1035120 RepID=UPI0004B4CF07|nr:MaoC family dehydratase [Deferrisoma camini]
MIHLDAVGEVLGPFVHRYSWRDVVLYHLGIGARASDLEYVYEGVAGGLRVCPSFAVVPVLAPYMAVLRRLRVPVASILHGEQTIRLHGPLPPEGEFHTTARASAVYDKGKAALLIAESRTTDASGALLFETRAAVLCRGMGGWGGDPGPRPEPRTVPGDRPPDFEASEPTAENQAALYRLCGDTNPLHIDPAAARAAGFPRPILHGLCTFGFVCRAVVSRACGGNPTRLREMGVRFVAPVFPGQTITTRGWRVGPGTYHLGVSTESGEVLSNAYARVDEG